MTPPVPDNVPAPPSGVFVAAVAKVNLWQKVLLSALGVMTTGGAGFLTWALITLGTLGQVQAQVKAQSDSTERSLDIHLKAQAAKDIIDAQRDEAREQARIRDMKALYDAVIKRKRSTRLERLDAGEVEE